MQIEEILIIKNAQEHYGISTKDINQISRVPSLMLLPICPFGVRGLCSVSGNVVSMIDMNLLLGVDKVDIQNQSARLVSLTGALSSNTLLVSDVIDTVEIQQNNIEYLESEEDSVIAIYKHEDTLIQIVSLEKLFSIMKNIQIKGKEISSSISKEISVVEEQSTRFLVFAMANEKFALNIDYLQEIILADIEITELANSSEEVMGLITLREELLVVVDLRKYYGFKSVSNDTNRILILSCNGEKIALFIDSIIDIKNYLQKNIEFMQDQSDTMNISGVIHAQDGLISFFDKSVIEEIMHKNEAFMHSNDTATNIKDEEDYCAEVIVFKLAGREYAFNVESVDEIIDVMETTDIVFSDEYVDGIINIRGQIVAIVSLFKKLNLQTTIYENSKIIICNINDDRIGFVVDSVSDILNIKKNDVREDEDGYFENILHLDNGNRLVLSMDIKKIVVGA